MAVTEYGWCTIYPSHFGAARRHMMQREENDSFKSSSSANQPD
jgi:hypothetical protein